MLKHRKNIALYLVTAVPCLMVLLSGCGEKPIPEAGSGESIYEKQNDNTLLEKRHIASQEITTFTDGSIKNPEVLDKFQFLFFYEKGSKLSDRMAKVINKAKNRWSDRSIFRGIDINDSKQKNLLWKYGVWEAPVTLVIAPGGTTVIAGFPGVVDLDKLEQAFISPKTVEIVGGLQQKKTIFLTVHNINTQYAKENAKVISDVAEVLGKSVKIVEVDPNDEQEASLLKQLKVKLDSTNAVTLVIARGGVIVDRFDGNVTNKELFASFKKVLAKSSGCGGGSNGGGGGGCGGG